MSNATQQFKAQQRRQKFADLLREMFQLNQPELDFGLYRIMHARKDDINRFIDQDLPRITQEAFSQYASQDQAQLEAELEEHIKSAKGLGMDPDAIPKVQELKQQLQGGFDLAREEGEVYDALVTFFSRYYNEGDFLSRRVYKDGTYAIPYQGEEVVLHWANKDQYYIKSSETLRDYSFRLNPDAGPGEDPMRVHFKLVDAEAGAKDNNKESADSRRVFVLDVENPFELTEGEATEHGDKHTELQCRFLFRPATESDWTEAEKKKATAAAQKKPPTQDALKVIAEERLLGAASDLPEPWKSALTKPYRKADGNRADYSMLTGQLNNYTKKNTFDYFIHKDLGGFLTRELDFYIKNELLDWEDIASLKNDSARLAPLLSKIEVIRSLGEKIITFLAQLENFQKKLWLKKKFVTETNYCITVGRLEEQPDLLKEAFDSDKQLKDWESLYRIDLEQLEKDCKSLSWKELLAKPKYRYMMVDTGNFGESYKAKILAGIDGLDQQCEGVIINSENFQALNLLQERYKEKVKCIYIDPPYNTGGDGFAYKDRYQHSSWLTMIRERLSASHGLLSNDGVIFASIDNIERANLEQALNHVFSERNRVEEIVWTQNTTKNQSPTYSTNHEYVEVYAKDIVEAKSDFMMFREAKPGFKEIMDLLDKLNPEFPPVEEIELALRELYREHKRKIKESGGDAIDEWKGIYNYNRAEYRDECGRFVDEASAESKSANIWVWREDNPSMPQIKEDSQKAEFRDPDHPAYRFYNPIHPITGNPCPAPKRGWSWPFDPLGRQTSCFSELAKDHRIAWGEDENKIPQTKRFLHEVESNVAKSVIIDFSDGEKELTDLFGRTRSFAAPKPTTLIQRFIQHSNVGDDGLVCDFFSGSGTAGHAVLAQNHIDGGKRKFLLVEMGDHFNSVLKPRLMKVAYTPIWDSGDPVLQESTASHCFKYVRLESYDDALGNLSLERNHGQQQLLNESKESNSAEARQSYVMNYMLEVETRNSPSLLNTRQFVDPTQYKLNVHAVGGYETRSVNVDLLETFNYLLGMTVDHIAAPIYFDAELDQGEYGRWQAKVKRSETGKWWFRTVYGTNRTGQQVLVVWRNLPSVIDGEADGIQKDNAVLDAVLIEKLSIRLTESQDDEIDVLYVNGDHNISIPRSRKGEPMEQARIQLIEEAFHRLMFADTEAVH